MNLNLSREQRLIYEKSLEAKKQGKKLYIDYMKVRRAQEEYCKEVMKQYKSLVEQMEVDQILKELRAQ